MLTPKRFDHFINDVKLYRMVEGNFQNVFLDCPEIVTTNTTVIYHSIWNLPVHCIPFRGS
jgi:hypothetical protein